MALNNQNGVPKLPGHAFSRRPFSPSVLIRKVVLTHGGKGGKISPSPAMADGYIILPDGKKGKIQLTATRG